MARNYKFQWLTIFTKSFILDVWLGPEYAPESYFFNICLNLREKSISEVFLNISRFNIPFQITHLLVLGGFCKRKTKS